MKHENKLFALVLVLLIATLYMTMRCSAEITGISPADQLEVALNTSDIATKDEIAEAYEEAVEDFENEKIEEALLAQAYVIENCTITHYCAEEYPHICGDGDGIAADGTPAIPWTTCAVDPSVIPLGSTILVDLGDGEGLRYFVANDTGVTGNHVDLCVSSHDEADNLGIKTATVYWCEEG